MSKALTKRQSEILSFIGDFTDQFGFHPTIREIADSFGFKSSNSAQSHLHALVRKGYLSSAGRKARAYSVLKES